MSKKDGGPAFPLQATFAGGEYFSGTDGMSLRDYFAAKAMKEYLTAYPPDNDYLSDDLLSVIAREAYRAADAMLAAREQGE